MFFYSEYQDMDKKTSTVSSRWPPELEERMQAIASTRGISLSDLIYQLAVAEDRIEYERYTKLSRVYGTAKDLLGKQGLSAEGRTHEGSKLWSEE
jgi:hypothetical protein